MSVTYTEDRVIPFGETVETRAEEPFVPRYARTGKTARGGKTKVKTWMILAPLGVVVLGGVVAALVMAPREESLVSPTLSEPANTAPVLSAAPVPAAITADPAPVLAEPARAPVAREATRAPVVRSTPARRPSAPRAASTPPVEAPAVVPQSSPATTTLNTAPVNPAPAPAPAQPPAPQIVVQPLG